LHAELGFNMSKLAMECTTQDGSKERAWKEYMLWATEKAKQEIAQNDLEQGMAVYFEHPNHFNKMTPLQLWLLPAQLEPSFV